MEKIELSQIDLSNLLAIIELASQKGCFKASDLATIGELYEKIQKMNEKDEKNSYKKD